MESFQHLGVMLDCSRNAVFNLPSIKKYIDLLAKMGYNTLMLYTEDTYEVQNQPYFGYLRGRYSKEELRQIDTYCQKQGVELIACIQTLAHLDAAVRWPVYAAHTDFDNILLIGDERTYQLIDAMFATVEECFTSKRIHIGMDEAYMVGLGQYLQQHGYQNRFDVLKGHLDRVLELAHKHGLKPMMWSDMFFRIKNNGEYYTTNPDIITPDVAASMPEGVLPVYWDYYTDDQRRYQCMLEAHKSFGRETWFAGGLWTWTGFMPHNEYSIRNNRAAISACRQCGVQNAFFTMWGDNGGETSFFSALPALYYTAQLAQGIDDEAEIRAGFEQLIGIPFDDFLLLDMPAITCGTNANPDKYMLYNDYFAGIYDPIADEQDGQRYAALAKKAAALASHPEYGYLFAELEALCEVLAHKNDIGLRTRRAYQARNTAALAKLAAEYRLIAEKIELFYQRFHEVWMRDNKPYGFEIQDIRLGGLKARTIRCAERLQKLADGEIERIDELEETLLDPECRPERGKRKLCILEWQRAYANRL